jgi:thioredoxin 2
MLKEEAMASVVLACAACGANNRIPAGRLTDRAACGRCKTQLAGPHEPIEADEALFDEVVANSKVPVLVDFWAAWCGPCRMAAPEVHSLAREMQRKALVLKVDTEAHPRLAERYGVQSIPNFVVFVNGQPVLQRAGVAPRAEMRRWLERSAAVR